MAAPRLKNEEFRRWTSILGAYKILSLHEQSKITLSSSQLDVILKLKNEEPKKKVVKKWMILERG